VPPLLRLVLDTNILLRGLINARSASGRIVDACDRRRVLMLLSRPLLAEYRGVLTDPGIVERYPELTTPKVEIVLRRLQYVGEVLRAVKARFDDPRDPKDSKVIELAIAGDATHIVSADNDLLSLPAGRGDAARRFRQRLPGTEVLGADDFLDRYGQALEANP
jgi:putative PIN family toxin of toxin-antitoxin system